MSKEMTPEDAARIVSDWSKDKHHFKDVRDLMGFLAHAEIAAAAHGHKTGTNFVRGANSWDLDALYKAAVAAHPGVQAKLAKQAAKGTKNAKPQRESVRDSINRAITGKPTEKPQRESVKDSIERARSEVKGR